MDHAALHARARNKGVNPIVYWLVRAVIQPFFHLYFRLSRIGPIVCGPEMQSSSLHSRPVSCTCSRTTCSSEK